ncbi:MAG: hypothetical protein RLZZ352_495 [Pseudomonadota bacterium]|jgi:ankyrin repeat protein
MSMLPWFTVQRWLTASVLGLFLAPQVQAQANPNAYFRAIVQNNESGVIAYALQEHDLNVRNDKNEHPLHMALRLDSLQVVNFLLDLNAVDVNAKNAHDETPLMIAALKGQLHQAQRLIARGAEVNKPGWAPLHYAASNADDNLAMVRLLLEHHAYIDAESPNGTTPLMMAARYSTPALVQFLIDEGADPSVKNEQGLTAQDFAQQAGRHALASKLAALVSAASAPSSQ